MIMAQKHRLWSDGQAVRHHVCKRHILGPFLTPSEQREATQAGAKWPTLRSFSSSCIACVAENCTVFKAVQSSQKVQKCPALEGEGAIAGQGRSGMRLKEVGKTVGSGHCRLKMRLGRAIAERERVARSY